MATNTYDDIYRTFENQRFNQIDRRTLKRAVRPYQKYGVTLAGAIGKSDNALRSMAVKAVLAKFKASKRKPGTTPKPKPVPSARVPRALQSGAGRPRRTPRIGMRKY
jgi:hypothetical protein